MPVPPIASADDRDTDDQLAQSDADLFGGNGLAAANPLTEGASPAHRPARCRRWLRSVRPSGDLWAHADFRRFWAAQTVSQFGSHVTTLAPPLTAAVTLDAGPGQIGLLVAAERLPFLLFGLLAGVWVDRRRRRPLLVLADYGRAALLAAVPVTAPLGVLRMELLYAVALLTGAVTLVFDVAYVAYLPALVPRERLADGNGTLEASYSVAQAAGPGLAGVRVWPASGSGSPPPRSPSPWTPPRTCSRRACSAGSPPRSRRRAPPLTGERRSPARWPTASGCSSATRSCARAGCSAMTSPFGYAFLAVYVLFLTRVHDPRPRARAGRRRRRPRQRRDRRLRRGDAGRWCRLPPGDRPGHRLVAGRLRHRGGGAAGGLRALAGGPAADAGGSGPVRRAGDRQRRADQPAPGAGAGGRPGDGSPPRGASSSPAAYRPAGCSAAGSAG